MTAGEKSIERTMRNLVIVAIVVVGVWAYTKWQEKQKSSYK